MVLSRVSKSIAWCVLAWFALSGLAAGDHYGQVKFGGLPVPGAAVTLSQGEKKLTAITGPQGEYSFADVTDGLWTIQIEMLCFAPLQNEIAVAPNAPPAQWELKMLPLDQMKTVAPSPPSVAPPPTVTSDATSRATPASAPPAKGRNAGKNAPAGPPANAQAGFQRTDLNASKDAGKVENEDPGVG